MIRDRYEPMQLFELVPQLQLRVEPELAELDRLLEDDVLFRQVRDDLARRWPRSLATGRPSTPVEVVLRMLVVKHLYGWSYEETERWVSDSLVLRQFCRLYLAPAPDDTTLLRWAKLIRPETLHRLLDRVTDLARSLKVTRGRKLRTDSTVVRTNIHHPSDSSLLADGVRVISRLVGSARAVLGTCTSQARDLFRNRTRSAKRLAKQIAQTAAQPEAEREGLRKCAYRRLLAVAQASLRQAETIRELLDHEAGPAAERLRAGIDRFRPLVARVIEQTERRVMRGEAVAATEKVLSLFEPQTALIKRGKVHEPTEFGNKVVVDEVDGGLITRYAILPGNPPDARSLSDSLCHHRARFGRPPDLLCGDRSFHNDSNERMARQAGVRRVALPKPGAKTASRKDLERKRWFRRACRFRAGIEGRISVLKRRFRLDRCRYHGEDGMERWVGLGVIAHNLRLISQSLASRKAA